nr:uncharacterized protein LOC117225637 [Megalopta genalis]XP_033335206.1 uncharacterized protein LOC117225637 [Megalopta genalis]XP_033335207.1 uncharacterized protein LOC117225637 [Megalopta genalis]XP_033335208.1 uncharacterized protein LOC117225637 [Megalopta genalis]
MATDDNIQQIIRDLKMKRRVFKSQMTNLSKFVTDFRDSDGERAKLRNRVERLRIQFDSFNDIQNKLHEYEDPDEIEAERESTTETYDTVIANAEVLLDKLGKADLQSVSTTRGTISSPTPTMSGTTLGVHLPKIDLPQFDGRLERWITFKDTFQNTIHAHPHLTDVQKLSYLRLSLTGKAASAIDSLPISENNYKAAWEQLVEDYDNTRALVLRHTSLLIDTPAMPDNSADSIRDLVNHMQAHIRSLQALGRSRENIAHDLLTNIAIAKMNPDTRKTWETTLVGTNMPNMPARFLRLPSQFNEVLFSCQLLRPCAE